MKVMYLDHAKRSYSAMIVHLAPWQKFSYYYFLKISNIRKF